MDKRLRQAILVLTVIGLLVSIYMTIYKITNNESMCIGSGGCSIVNASGYSELYGIPVALFGVAGYLSILAVLFLERRAGFFAENSGMILFGLTLIGFLFTVWLVFVEVALIKAYCPFCITSQISMTIIFILTVIRIFKQPYQEE
jgi:uncharacterized membrane protein